MPDFQSIDANPLKTALAYQELGSNTLNQLSTAQGIKNAQLQNQIGNQNLNESRILQLNKNVVDLLSRPDSELEGGQVLRDRVDSLVQQGLIPQGLADQVKTQFPQGTSARAVKEGLGGFMIRSLDAVSQARGLMPTPLAIKTGQQTYYGNMGGAWTPGANQFAPESSSIEGPTWSEANTPQVTHDAAGNPVTNVGGYPGTTPGAPGVYSGSGAPLKAYRDQQGYLHPGTSPIPSNGSYTPPGASKPIPDSLAGPGTAPASPPQVPQVGQPVAVNPGLAAAQAGNVKGQMADQDTLIGDTRELPQLAISETNLSQALNILHLLKSAPVGTGAGAETINKVESYLKSLGYKGSLSDDVVSREEAAKYLAATVLGANAHTDAERSVVQQANASMDKTPETNLHLLQQMYGYNQMEKMLREDALNNRVSGMPVDQAAKTYLNKKAEVYSKYDPFVFAIPHMTPQEISKYYNSLTADQKKKYHDTYKFAEEQKIPLTPLPTEAPAPVAAPTPQQPAPTNSLTAPLPSGSFSPNPLSIPGY